MKNAANRPVIAYLAPETLAPWATFVYEEILGLERRGFPVIPFSVHRPPQTAPGQDALVERTLVIYDGPKLNMVLQGLMRAPQFGHGAWKALRWLASDMADQGLFRRQSWKLAFQFLAAVRLAGWLRQHGCAHLHVHFAHVSAQIAMYASALSGIPFTVMAHANDIFERGMLLPRKAERASMLLTISGHNRAYLEKMGVAPNKIAVVRCGVSFCMRQDAPVFERRDQYRIGTLGRLVEKKGVDVLIRAMAELRDRPYRIELSVAGNGPLRDELKELARSLGLAGSVHFEGSISHSSVSDWMRRLDVFALACRRDANGDMDGIPVVLMEAMSQAIPVISTRLSGIPELVVHEATGLLANPGDHLDMARQIDRMLESAELRTHLAGRALEHVHREFGQDINLDRLLGYFGFSTPATSGA